MVPTDADLELPALTMHYRTWGNPEDPAIVLLHGMLASGRWYDEVAKPLAMSHFVVLPDLHGHGKKSRADDYSWQRWVEDVEGLVDALGLEPFDLVAILMVQPWRAGTPDCIRIRSSTLSSWTLVSGRPTRPRSTTGLAGSSPRPRRMASIRTRNALQRSSSSSRARNARSSTASRTLRSSATTGGCVLLPRTSTLPGVTVRVMKMRTGCVDRSRARPSSSAPSSASSSLGMATST